MVSFCLGPTGTKVTLDSGAVLIQDQSDNPCRVGCVRWFVCEDGAHCLRRWPTDATNDTAVMIVEML